MEINLLLRLIIAHLLTDFVLQPKSWVADRQRNKGKSGKLYLHVILTTIVAYIFSGLYSNWMIPLTIFITHLLIDYVKAKTGKDKFSYFIADQLAHLFVIFALWLSVENKWSEVMSSIHLITETTGFWIIATGYVFVSWPLGIVIGKATQKWRDQLAREKAKLSPPAKDIIDEEGTTEPVTIQPSEEQELGLANAGKWIGICERILILTFVLMSQYTAIGFLMTAKSILRFSEKEANTQLKTEYVLVGTLVSFASSALVGVIINLALKLFFFSN